MLRDRSICGFTMIEVLIAVVIIGILATLAVPSFLEGMASLHLKAAARDQVSYLRLARSQAVTEGRPVGAYVDTSSQALSLFYDNNDNMVFDGGDSTILGPISMPGETRYCSCSFPNTSLIFKPNGSASASGSVEVFSPADSTSRRYTIEVLASTGRVKLR